MIDHEKIGAGVYAILDDNDKAVVALGMIPLHAMELVTELMKEKVAALGCEEYGIEPTPENVKALTSAIKPAFIAKFQREVTVAIMGAAKSADRMIA